MRAVLRWAWPMLVAWLMLAGVVFGRFANNAFPTDYLVRPLLVAAAVALLIGLAATRLREHGALAAFIGAGLVAFWSSWIEWWWALGVALAVWLGLRYLAARRGFWFPSVPRAASTAAAAFAIVFAGSGLVRAWISAEGPITPVIQQREPDGPNLYLVMLDGYPRADTLLDDMGIENSPFLDALSTRGFDLYPDSMSDRRFTDLTLMTLLTGTTDGVPQDTDFGHAEQWRLRRALSEAELPRRAQEAGYEWWIIDSPAGHVTFAAGNHIRHDGITTLEDQLLGQSLLGPVIAAAWPTLPTDTLRDHFDDSVDSLLDLVDPDAHRLVLAHLFQPHTPFLWDAAGDPVPALGYWPQVNLFAAQIEVMGMSLDEYAGYMRGDLQTLNARVLTAVDTILHRDPEAVVVLFSDHGSRYSEAQRQTEWYRNFLAARTPGHPNLFADDPAPTNLLRTLLPIYMAGASE